MIFTNPNKPPEVVNNCYQVRIKNICVHGGTGHGSQSKEASVFMKDKPEINFIDGACPMMYGPSSDFFHKEGRKNPCMDAKVPA